MDRDEITETFFKDQKDCIDFLVSKKQIIIASDKGEYFAELKKEKDCFLYTLTFNADEKYIGDYDKPFRATLENIKTFNNGCKILAERLLIYLDTNNINSVPSSLPAFGNLTHFK